MIPWILCADGTPVNLLTVGVLKIVDQESCFHVCADARLVTACGTQRKAKSIIAKLVKETASKVFDFTDSDVEE